MHRLLIAIVACLAVLGPPGARAQTAGRLEMDVLEADETPAQALKRMEDAARRANAEPTGPAERPDLAPFIPEDSLGARGLLVPDPAGLGDLERDPLRPDLPGLSDLLPLPVLKEDSGADDKDDKDDHDKHGSKGGDDGKGEGKG